MMRMICLNCGACFDFDGPLNGCPACGSCDCDAATPEAEGMQLKTPAEIREEHADTDDEGDD